MSNLKPRGCIFCDCSCGSGAAGHRSWGDLGLLRYHEKISKAPGMTPGSHLAQSLKFEDKEWEP